MFYEHYAKEFGLSMHKAESQKFFDQSNAMITSLFRKISMVALGCSD